MSFQSWLAFTTACIVLTVIPGPSVLLVVGQAITRGKSAAFACVLGDVLGGVVLVGLSFLGLGTLLAASALLFQVVKWAGVFYLGFLGYRQIVSAKESSGSLSNSSASHAGWRSFWAGAVTAVFNPKAIIFYVAFLSQFIDPDGSMMAQLAIMTVTSSLVVMVLLGGYVLLASQARQMLKSRAAQRKIEYTGGACLIGGSIFMAATR